MKFRLLFQEATETPAAGGGAPAASPEASPAPGATPAPGSAPENTVYFHPDGKLGDNWHAALGDEFAPHAAQAAQFKTVGDLFKSYVHLRSTGPAYPGEGATPEDIQRFHALAKVPVDATPEAYGLQLPTDLPAEERAVYDRILKTAHANHVSAPGLAAVVKEYQAIQAEEAAAEAAASAEKAQAARQELISAWKGNYEANASTVRHLTDKFGQAAGLDQGAIEQLANNPAFAKMMMSIASNISEDRIQTPAGFGDLRSNAQRADDIMSGKDPVWGEKYVNGSTEEKQAAYNEVARLLGEAQR